MARTAQRNKAAQRASKRRHGRAADRQSRSAQQRRSTLRPRGTASPAVSLVGWTAALVLAVAVAAGIVGAVSIPFGGYAPANSVAVGALGVLAAGLFISFGLALVWSILPQIWADAARNWVRPATRTELGWRIAGSIPMAALVIAVFLLSLAPMTEFSASLDDLYSDVLGPAVVALVIASVVVAAVVGAMVMAGWRGSIIGLVFAFGFVGGAWGAYSGEQTLLGFGMAALCVSVGGYYLIGALSGYLPAGFRASYSGSAGLLFGVGTITVGVIVFINTGDWFGLLLGGTSLAAWAGIAIADRRAGRMRPARETAD
jgi:hypothetical protein